MQETLTQVPLSVPILRIHPRGVGLLHERIPILRRAAEKDGDEAGKAARVDGQSINIHDLLVVLAEVEVLFVVEEKVLRWGSGDD